MCRCTDQRGEPFTRVYGGRIDIGAVEVLPAGFLPGDFSLDGVVDAADYSLWRNSLGTAPHPGPLPEGEGVVADGNGDGKVDALDYAVWKSNFGASFDFAQDVAADEQGAGSRGQGVTEDDKEIGRQGDQETLLAGAVVELSSPQADIGDHPVRRVRQRAPVGVAVRQDRLLEAWTAARPRMRHDFLDELATGDRGRNVAVDVIDTLMVDVGESGLDQRASEWRRRI